MNALELAFAMQESRIRHWLARHQYCAGNELPKRCSGCSKRAFDGASKCESCLERQRLERDKYLRGPYQRRQAVA